ncbi:MAG TPA: hypothetical protein VLI92_04420 [Candidatus Saccharimonadales bacterium]|nr:hypothetical protein [Candidatus Saccharimonadales bacterium]
MKALDVSTEKRLTSTEHFGADINQLYHPTKIYDQDLLDLIYSFDNVNLTKFTNILLKEWFNMLSVGGYLVIDYRPNLLCDFHKLEEYMWWLWKDYYEIVYHGSIEKAETENKSIEDISNYITDRENYYLKDLDLKTLLPKPFKTTIVPVSEDGYVRFVCKKTKSSTIPNDSMDKWTFGIITNGKRDEWMNTLIESIRSQKIPNYEILVCGQYYVRDENDIHYIPFEQRYYEAWITKKKNLIVKQAKYENICMLHDRLFLDKDWYKGMQSWGNCFEHLGCKQLFEDKRVGDWVVLDSGRGTFYPIYNVGYNFVSLLDYKDHDNKVFLGGQLHIFKKSIVEKILWNETYLWVDRKPEDLDLALRLRDSGFLTRFNPEAIARTHILKFGNMIEIEFNSVKRGGYKNYYNKRLWGRYILKFLGFLKVDKLVLSKFYNDKLIYKLFKIKI